VEESLQQGQTTQLTGLQTANTGIVMVNLLKFTRLDYHCDWYILCGRLKYIDLESQLEVLFKQAHALISKSKKSNNYFY